MSASTGAAPAASAPFAMSSTSTRTPAAQPTLRAVFMAPMFPEPTSKMSFFHSRAITRALGNEPMK